MQKAIWKIASFGEFAFHGTKSNQLMLGIENPDWEPLKEALKVQFRGKAWVTVEEITTFVASDQTDYHTGQLKTYALKPMEDNAQIVVDETSRNRRRTYPDGTRIRFV